MMANHWLLIFGKGHFYGLDIGIHLVVQVV